MLKYVLVLLCAASFAGASPLRTPASGYFPEVDGSWQGKVIAFNPKPSTLRLATADLSSVAPIIEGPYVFRLARPGSDSVVWGFAANESTLKTDLMKGSSMEPTCSLQGVGGACLPCMAGASSPSACGVYANLCPAAGVSHSRQHPCHLTHTRESTTCRSVLCGGKGGLSRRH